MASILASRLFRRYKYCDLFLRGVILRLAKLVKKRKKMEEIFCNPAFSHILEEIFLQLGPQDLENCRKVNTNFKNVLDQLLWFKFIQARGSFEYGQNFNSWKTLVKLTSRTLLRKNVAKILMDLNEIEESYIFPPLRETMLFSFTPLHMVAHQGFDLELMKFMVGNLKKFGYESLDQCLDEYNRHPLHIILKNNGNIEMIKLMIENMKNVNVKMGDQMWTPLHVAAMYDNLEAVKSLLANGADPELESSEGGTPITFADIYGNQEILDCFFKFLGEENPYKAFKSFFTHAM